MKHTILFVLLFACCPRVEGQHSSEMIRKELSFEGTGKHTLMIFNISGSVSVTGTTGDKIIVEVEKVINAKTDRRLELGRSQVQLGIKDRADTIMLYVEGLCSEFGRGIPSHHDHDGMGETNHWGYQWQSREHRNSCNEQFDHQMNFTIRVPTGIDLYASTVNDGDIAVENIGGTLIVNNINGGISLKNISGATNASTINGEVDLEYAQNPLRECRYYSLNGDINAWFRKGLTADLTFESFNGGLYTNVDNVESKPTALVQQKTQDGLQYKIGGNQFRIGKGGVLLDFETFNGDVYVRERPN